MPDSPNQTEGFFFSLVHNAFQSARYQRSIGNHQQAGQHLQAGEKFANQAKRSHAKDAVNEIEGAQILQWHVHPKEEED